MKINKEYIKRIIALYGQYLPLDVKVDNYVFAKLINEHRGANNPISYKMYQYILYCVDLRFKRLKNDVKITILR